MKYSMKSKKKIPGTLVSALPLVFALIGCLVTHSGLIAQESKQLEQQELAIEWRVKSRKELGALRFSVSLYFDSEDADANRNIIFVIDSTGDEDADTRKIESVMRFISNGIFDEEKPLGFSASRGKDICFGAVCKLTAIDENSHLLVVELNQFGNLTDFVSGKSGIYLFENEEISSVVRVPRDFVFFD